MDSSRSGTYAAARETYVQVFGLRDGVHRDPEAMYGLRSGRPRRRPRRLLGLRGAPRRRRRTAVSGLRVDRRRGADGRRARVTAASTSAPLRGARGVGDRHGPPGGRRGGDDALRGPAAPGPRPGRDRRVARGGEAAGTRPRAGGGPGPTEELKQDLEERFGGTGTPAGSGSDRPRGGTPGMTPSRSVPGPGTTLTRPPTAVRVRRGHRTVSLPPGTVAVRRPARGERSGVSSLPAGDSRTDAE